jgi:hypothetical protein
MKMVVKFYTHYCFTFWRYPVRISAERRSIVTEDLVGLLGPSNK